MSTDSLMVASYTWGFVCGIIAAVLSFAILKLMERKRAVS